jgi:hypothetical protein
MQKAVSFDVNNLMTQKEIRCRNHYFYNYSYGNYCELIGKNEWFWDIEETVYEKMIRGRERSHVIFKIQNGDIDFILYGKSPDFNWKKCGF